MQDAKVQKFFSDNPRFNSVADKFSMLIWEDFFGLSEEQMAKFYLPNDLPMVPVIHNALHKNENVMDLVCLEAVRF